MILDVGMVGVSVPAMKKSLSGSARVELRDGDVGDSSVNYTARASVVATSKGQGGRDLSNLAGVTVPVRITGALKKPNIAVDFTELAAKSGVGLVKALGSAGGNTGKVKEKVGDKLRGLLRR